MYILIGTFQHFKRPLSVLKQKVIGVWLCKFIIQVLYSNGRGFEISLTILKCHQAI